MSKIFLIQGKEILILFRDYSILVSEAKYKAKHGKGLKILSPKQMPKSVNSSGTSESSNEFHKVINQNGY